MTSSDPGASAQMIADQDAWRQEIFEEEESILAPTLELVFHGLRPTDPQITSLQRAIIAAGCTLPQYGVDGRWGSETEAGIRCLANRQSWQRVTEQFPMVAQRMTVPSEATPTTTQVAQVAQPETESITSKIATAVKSVFSSQPTTTTQEPTNVQYASMGPSIPMPSGLPGWVPWVAGGAGLLGLIVLGAYLTRDKDDV
jgi:hypothetical protein